MRATRTRARSADPTCGARCVRFGQYARATGKKKPGRNRASAGRLRPREEETHETESDPFSAPKLSLGLRDRSANVTYEIYSRRTTRHVSSAQRATASSQGFGSVVRKARALAPHERDMAAVS